MWIIYSIIAAVFAGITAILASIGIKEINSTLATAIRTTVILIFLLIITIFTNSLICLKNISNKNYIFLVCSGITTALLWITYFKALQIGDVSKIMAIDKSSIVLTLIASSMFFNEEITIIKLISIILIMTGTIIMINTNNNTKNKKWIIYSILTAIFTSMTTILSKFGIKNVNTNISTLIRTFIAFIIIWIVVFINKTYKQIKFINKKIWLYILLTAISAGLSWLFYFKALEHGVTSIVFTIEKLNIVVTTLLSVIILKEKLNSKNIIGLVFIAIGTIILMI